MQAHQSAVKELQEQLGEKASMVDSLQQGARQVQQQLEEKLTELSTVRNNLDAANTAQGKAAKVTMMPS